MKEVNSKKTPYHLDKKVKIPLRTGETYLSTKYSYKKLSEDDKRENILKQKYDKLDKRLNKLRN